MRHTYYLVIRRTVSVEDGDDTMTEHERQAVAKDECLADMFNLTADGIEIDGKEVE